MFDKQAENARKRAGSNSFLRLKFKSRHRVEKAAQTANGGSAHSLKAGKESSSMSATGPTLPLETLNP